MRTLRLLSCAVLALSLNACSLFGGGAGDGNIPLAEPGSELKDANFAFDSSTLDSSAQATLRANAQWLLDNAGRKTVVEGHCDERGTAEYNLALGERRAKAAYDYLHSLGVATDRMSTVSYGEELPLDPGHTESAWSKNRRAHFQVK